MGIQFSFGRGKKKKKLKQNSKVWVQNLTKHDSMGSKFNFKVSLLVPNWLYTLKMKRIAVVCTKVKDFTRVS